jgi:pre-mRNA-splicing factor ATP-dependent RNA helicase DHX15/PRP43
VCREQVATSVFAMGDRKRKLSLFDQLDDSRDPNKPKVQINGAMPLISTMTGRPYTQRYFDILEKRKTLPVWQQKAEFIKMLAANQIIILVGETGSGKTTQVCQHCDLSEELSRDLGNLILQVSDVS